ncbi:MAG: aldo/keto reductase family protein [Planctomycetota bacterium]|nr:aldo/keto reductase family protein [Planctomycetota bacterium]
MAARSLGCYNAYVQYRYLGGSGVKVSAIGLGSWLTIGNEIDDAASEDLVAKAFERGVNLFDTADVYNQGEGERALGRSIGALPRHNLLIATKCYLPMSDDVNDRGLSRKHIHESIKQSLRRLGTDYVDLYQCHRFDPEVPLRETALAMHDLIQQGHVLYWGLSMWPAERIAEVAGLCRREGWHAPVTNQPLYNLYRRDIEASVVPTSLREGLGQLVYSPLAQGVLTGKYTPGGALPSGSRATDESGKQFVSRYMTDEHLQKAQRLTELAARHGYDATQVALAFCLRNEGVSSVLIGAKSVAQLDHNLSALDATLSSECVAELHEIFPA